MSYPFDLTPLSVEEQQAAAQEFRRIDRDGNGHLDAKELEQYLVKKPQLRCFPRLIIHIFGSNETIDWSQFYYSYRSFSASPDDENYIGRKIFDFIDKDKSGSISGTEFDSILSYIDAPKGQLQQFLCGSGTLTYPQFKDKFYRLLTLIWRSCGFESQQCT
ncbi:hypothetical protein TRFO_11164 [Tritrichomonas foetus]|uniref:EF-hand domain-containing protein n=1 Tax=Tritrichomonas foetus TaxID=1144522 RepID=A0A1J4J4Q2_9EUKA|nr:hypothetical protein TRFO_11164 [Tritrichomonas foetus]|eukprot:OHS94314.1 hypothetical protein TRFO_11164 [Tritrichomonas foetus]